MDEIIKKCRLFDGISDNDIDELLEGLGAKKSTYKKGETVIRAFETVRSTGIVTSGTLRALRTDINGNNVIISILREGDIFGHALENSSNESDVAVCADSSAEVMWLYIKKLDMLRPCAMIFMHNLVGALSEKIIAFNTRINILSKKTIRERVITYLIFSGNGKRTFKIPFGRSDMADYLAVDRSALSRELSNMEREGLLSFHRNEFTLNPDKNKQ